jgi:phosphotransferase system IIB component
MKNRLLLITLLFFYYQSNAQNLVETQFSKNILRNWAKYRLEMKDGSALLDENLSKNTASMIIFKRANGVIIVTGRKAQQSRYSLIDSVLILDKTTAYIVILQMCLIMR